MPEIREMVPDIHALKARFELVMSEMFSLYSEVLKRTEFSDIGQIYVEKLFSRAIEEPVEQEVRPFEAISQYVQLSYDRETLCKARWSLRPRTEGRGLGIPSNTLHIAIDDPGGTGWFSMELFLSWAEVRTFRNLRVQMVAASSAPIGCQTFIRLLSRTGQIHDISPRHFALGESPSVQDVTLELDVPHNIAFDNETRPILVFLFEPKITDIRIEFISLISS